MARLAQNFELKKRKGKSEGGEKTERRKGKLKKLERIGDSTERNKQSCNLGTPDRKHNEMR